MTPVVRKRPVKPTKETTTIAFVGLGSNLGERESTIKRALEAIEGIGGTSVLRVSTLRETDPVGLTDQPRFLNGAAMISTREAAGGLLQRLLDVERRLGRDRSASPPGGPRTIDLDLLLYGDETIDEPSLQVPHPRLHEREFVLEPLLEISPELVIPGRGPVWALLAKLK